MCLMFTLHSLRLLVPTDPCDISLCSHPRHHCKVVDGSATCVCSELCPLILQPVCGSDGKSYPNNCSLEVEECITGKELTVVALGECGKLPYKVRALKILIHPTTLLSDVFVFHLSSFVLAGLKPCNPSSAKFQWEPRNDLQL